MDEEKTKLSTGVPVIDQLIDGLRWGDNVVWQVTTALEYSWLVAPFIQEAAQKGVNIIYMHFDSYEIPGTSPHSKLISIDRNQGFDYFYRFVREVMESAGKRVYYVFDNLSLLARQWGSDESLANFFRTVCPRLFELETIAYFCILRGSHNNQTVARIRDTTQVLIDFYVQHGQSYLRPLKVWDRYSPTMFETYQLISPVGKAPEGPWEGAEQVPKIMTHETPPQSEYLQPIETLLRRLKARACWSPANCEALRMELIKTFISQRSEYFQIARKYFSLEDLEKIYDRMVGSGRIGGKSAGMLLARKILEKATEEDLLELKEVLQDHDSFYIGSDVFFEFLLDNDLLYLLSQQYQDRETIVSEYPNLRNHFLAGEFRPETITQCKKVLEHFGTHPIIVRSSSLLEDNFGYAFAGKYESIFCPNQGDFNDRLHDFLNAIKIVYSSVLKPDALLYRMKHRLIYTDEQMAILVMRVEGQKIGNFFMPMVAGVGFSRNFHPWSPRIDTNKGLLRIVYGLGTRAVDRVGNDYPRMIALSHPTLRPVLYESEIKRYSQHQVDVIDLFSNLLKTKQINELVDKQIIPGCQYIFSIHDDGTILDPIGIMQFKDTRNKILTFNNFIKKTPFAALMDKILCKLEAGYGIPVDIEFVAEVDERGRVKINLLQCRPLSEVRDQENVSFPEKINPEDLIFQTDACVNTASVENIHYLVYVDSEGYHDLPPDKKLQIARAIGRINAVIEGHDERYILIGPGRWGSNNIDLGVKVTYADIDAAAMIVEVAKSAEGYVPEVSYGTHFFQDLVEDRIYYLAVYPGLINNYLNEKFFYHAPNLLMEIVPEFYQFSPVVRVISHQLTKSSFRVAMDRKQNRAVCYCVHP
ncbi:MAG TPA: PEP/pyruvate-binding domain-containing protein [Thermodesulfobacteriota bacterium]|nr:PEP/pyruvate-binding domain-containing protein [Thermodesulfobacteriota bacterium]